MTKIQSAGSAFKFATVLIAAAATLAVGAGCKKVAPPCAAKFEHIAAATECACAPQAMTGSVWGSGIYTSDSSICNAALHAGAVEAVGGNVTPTPAAGCPAYSSSTANGVTSSEWGSFDSSFTFPGHGDGKCAAPKPTPAKVVAVLPTDGTAACPTSAEGIIAASEMSCTCAGGGQGSVYGSGIYTTDSSICAAAQNAGAVPATGGVVKLKKAPGCAKYEASTKNGVTTSSWASYHDSFYFVGFGDGACAK